MIGLPVTADVLQHGRIALSERAPKVWSCPVPSAKIAGLPVGNVESVDLNDAVAYLHCTPIAAGRGPCIERKRRWNGARPRLRATYHLMPLRDISFSVVDCKNSVSPVLW